MLPPGHIAAGYLTAVVVVKFVYPTANSSLVNEFLLWGMLFGFLPDLDNFFAFYKMKSWWYKKGVDGGMHRKFYSHVPLLWLLAGIILYFGVSSLYWKTVVVLMVTGSFSHFILDSIEYGVKWLWPFSDKLYALKNAGVNAEIPANGFFNFWFSFLKLYKTRLTFYLEVVVICLAILVFINFKF